MAIEEENMADRQVWSEVSKRWYPKAPDPGSTTGRLYHHLAFCGWPGGTKQLFYYAITPCVTIPFERTRERVMTLPEPAPYFECLATTDKHHTEFEDAKRDFLAGLDNLIAKSAGRSMEHGQGVVIANGSLYLEDGNDAGGDVPDKGGCSIPKPPFFSEENLATEHDGIILQRIGDPDVLPYILTQSMFLQYMVIYAEVIFAEVMKAVEDQFHLCLLAALLRLRASYPERTAIASEPFAQPVKKGEGTTDLLPEDWLVRGPTWADGLHPVVWSGGIGRDACTFEKFIKHTTLGERILWHAMQLVGSWDRLGRLVYGLERDMLGTWFEQGNQLTDVTPVATPGNPKGLDDPGPLPSMPLPAIGCMGCRSEEAALLVENRPWPAGRGISVASV